MAANITVEYDGPIAKITAQEDGRDSPYGERLVGTFDTTQEDDVEVEVIENTGGDTGYDDNEASFVLAEAYMRFVDGRSTENVDWVELERF